MVHSSIIINVLSYFLEAHLNISTDRFFLIITALNLVPISYYFFFVTLTYLDEKGGIELDESGLIVCVSISSFILTI